MLHILGSRLMLLASYESLPYLLGVLYSTQWRGAAIFKKPVINLW